MFLNACCSFLVSRYVRPVLVSRPVLGDRDASPEASVSTQLDPAARTDEPLQRSMRYGRMKKLHGCSARIHHGERMHMAKLVPSCTIMLSHHLRD